MQIFFHIKFPSSFRDKKIYNKLFTLLKKITSSKWEKLKEGQIEVSFFTLLHRTHETN